MDFPRVAEMIRTFFEENDQRFALIGGFALQAYGLTRATYDLDFVTDAACQEDLIGFLEVREYRTLHRSAGYSNHQHEDSELGRLDFVYVRPPTSEKLFAAPRSVEVLPGIELPVPRPEHLAAMKAQAMKNDPTRRLQEMSDVRFLLGRPGVDRREIRDQFARRGLAAEFEELSRDVD